MFYINKASFVDFKNVRHFTIFLMTWAIIYASLIEGDAEYELLIAKAASVVSLFLYGNLFYWLQLYESSSFFVLMMTETLWEIRIFLFLFLIVMMTFANSFWIIDQKQKNL